MFKQFITIIFLIGAFCTLLFLGNWQLERLEWKESILADIAKQESTDPMAVLLDLSSAEEFQRGYIEGQFMRENPIRIAPRTYDGMVGYHFIQPFKTVDNEFILVNLGWVSNDTKFVKFNTRPTKIAGYLQSPDKPNRFTPKNMSDNNQWYSIDIDAVNAKYDHDFYPRVLYLESPKSEIPQTFSGLPQPRNNHAQYAMFWFGMAGLLVLLSGLFIYKQRKK